MGHGNGVNEIYSKTFHNLKVSNTEVSNSLRDLVSSR